MQAAATLRQRWAAQAAAQVQVNALADAGGLCRDIRAAIVGVADAKHAEYAQYAGYWDSAAWQLGQVTSRVRTKMGVAFERGDTVLYRGDGEGYVTVYSVRNGVNTSVRSEQVARLATTFRAANGLVTLTGGA